MRNKSYYLAVPLLTMCMLLGCSRGAPLEAETGAARQAPEEGTAEEAARTAAAEDTAGPVPASAVYESTPGVMGEVFGRPVKTEEFMYFYKTASIFTRMGKEVEDLDEDMREDARRVEAWQNLIYDHEAREIGIEISPEELETELKRLLLEQNIVYGTQEYKAWIPQAFGESNTQFEKRIEDLMRVNKFLNTKANPEISVTEEEMLEKFLNQYNSFESEYILFDTREEASEFHENVKNNPRLWWDKFQEKKDLGQKGASWINVMALEALIDLWKFPKEDAYKIVESDPGDFILAKNYYGDVVVRLLYKRRADLNDYDEKRKTYYRDMLFNSRRQRIVKDYFDDLFKRAGFRDYVEERKHREKVENMKQKSLVMLKTSKGDIALRLFPEEAPIACENFIGLIEKGYYDGIKFHRIVKDFMIQAGDPSGTGGGGESIWGERPFVDEINEELKFDKPGVLAMANSGPNSNTSQFFITVAPATHLDGKHTIFGKVIWGMDVVTAISEVETNDNEKPAEDVVISSAAIVKE